MEGRNIVTGIARSPHGDRKKIAGAAHCQMIKGPKHTHVADYEGMKRYRECLTPVSIAAE